MAGKGSAPRKGRDDKKYADNWDKIFKKPKAEFHENGIPYETVKVSAPQSP